MIQLLYLMLLVMITRLWDILNVTQVDVQIAEDEKLLDNVKFSVFFCDMFCGVCVCVFE